MKKEDHIKTFNKCFKIGFTIFLISFLALYVSQATGYYEYELNRQVTLTEEQIKKFEEDIKNGKELDIDAYLLKTNKNYQTNISKWGVTISNSISKYVSLAVDSFFNAIGKLVEE